MELERVKKVFRVAVPLMVQGLVFQLQSLTDKAFLGNLDTRYVSAAGAAGMPYVATVDSMAAISTGLVILVSRLFGAKKKDEIPEYVKSTALYNSILGAVVFSLLYFGAQAILGFFQIDKEIIGYSISYLKICSLYLLFVGMDSALQAMLHGMGETKPIMYAGILKVGLNIILSWILIFGEFGLPALNVTGAAIGTICANVLSFLFILSYCLCFKRELRLNKWGRKWCSVRAYIKVIRLGIPVGMEYLLWNASNLLLVRFINGFSYQDMAIYTLTLGFQSLIYVIFEGTSKGALSLMGQSIGAGDRKAANSFFYTSIMINFLIVAIAAICFFGVPKPLLGIFSNDWEIIERGAPFLGWIGIIMFPQSMNIICGNAIRANGNTKWMLFSQIFGSVFVVTSSWIFINQLHLTMTAVYITLFLDETLRGGINFLYYRKKYGVQKSK